MKEKIWGLLLAIIVAIIGYILVSTAAAHTARDHVALVQWTMNWSIRR